MSQRKRVPQKRPAVSKKKPTQYSESESDHHEKQEIDNLITSYEQQMKKRNLKRKQSEPDYKMLMTALYDESLDALKSCETRLKSALSRLSVEHLSKPNSRQINATMNASFETLEALVHHLDLDLETRQMQWDKRAMNRQQLGMVDDLVEVYSECKQNVASIKSKIQEVKETDNFMESWKVAILEMTETSEE